jgi:hypothetical protein
MHTIETDTNLPDIGEGTIYYGLGWMSFNQSGIIYEGHHGDIFGSHCRMKYRVSDKTGVIFFYNHSPPIKDKEKLDLTLKSFEIIFEELFKKADEL